MTVSVRDVAAAASVSVGTVSNVLNRPDRVSPETVARVLATIERLGFVRNDAARQLRAGRSRTVGLIVLDLRNPFFTEVARGAEERAAQHGLSVLVANSDEQATRESTHLDLFEQQRAFGVLITPVGDILPRVRTLAARGVPAVLVDRGSPTEDVASVAVDDVHGGRIAVQHLLEQNRRRIAFIGGPRTVRQVGDRLDGARSAIASVPGADLEVIDTPSLSVEAGRQAGRIILTRPPHARPDAIFAANDLIAVGLLQAMVMTGDVRIPHDIALIGYDDIDFAASAVIPLSSVHQPAPLIGSTAIDLLVGIASGGRAAERVRFRPELRVRATSALR